jgi:hypothetical protein
MHIIVATYGVQSVFRTNTGCLLGSLMLTHNSNSIPHLASYDELSAHERIVVGDRCSIP